jgi:hypothetical protein
VLVYCHAGCQQAAVIDALKRLDLPMNKNKPSPKPDPDEISKLEWALDFWHDAVPLINTDGEVYLNYRGIGIRGIRLDHCLRWNRQRQAMIALLTDVITGKACGIQLTPIKPDFTRSERRNHGRAKLGVVRLTADEEVLEGLHICEGVETGLSALVTGWSPIWACGSKANISAVPVLGGIECLTIIADNDANEGGIKAAKTCAERWQAAGREVIIKIPRRSQADLNDLSRLE